MEQNPPNNSSGDDDGIAVQESKQSSPVILSITPDPLETPASTESDIATVLVSDADQSAATLQLTVDNIDNPALVRSVHFGGHGANRLMIVIPNLGQTGQANIRLKVTDETNRTGTKTFRFVVEQTSAIVPKKETSNSLDIISPSEKRRIEAFRRKHKSGLFTLLFTDIVGSTHLIESLGDSQGLASIERHHAEVRKLLRRFAEAKEVSKTGDSFFIVFSKPSDAVRFALRLQAQLRTVFSATNCRLRNRIGIHVGEVFIEREKGKPHPKDFHGLQVIICERVMSLAHGDQILMTRAVNDNARQILKGENQSNLATLKWRSYGLYELEGVDTPQEVFEVGEIGLARFGRPHGGIRAKLQAPARAAASAEWQRAIGQIPRPVEIQQATSGVPLSAGNADFSGDGKADIVFQHSDGTVGFWFMNRTERMKADFPTPPSQGSACKVVGTGDFNNDKRPDLLFQNDNGALSVWSMEGTHVKSAKPLVPAKPGGTWRVVATGDLDGDGSTDVIFQDEKGFIAVWWLDGVLVKTMAHLKPNYPGDGWRVVGAGNLGGDGTIDLLFQHTDGDLAVWYLDGITLLETVWLSPKHAEDGWKVRGLADFDGDGKSDLLLQHTDGRVAIWFMDGTDLRSGELLQPPHPGAGWTVVGPK